MSALPRAASRSSCRRATPATATPSCCTARARRLLRHAAAGGEGCIAVTLVDGLVLARPVIHHSVNYRSAVLFGRGQPVTGDAEQRAARERFTERLIPGRWAEARPPNRVELKQTLIVAVPITSTSAKIRTGPPTDDADDLELPIWAGVLPLWQTAGTPVADLYLRDGIAAPDSIRRCRHAPGGDDELAVS